MIRIRQAVAVEGRYDAARLRALVDTPIIETNGFGVFRDRQLQAMLRRIGKEKGLIVLTDSDAAGFVIRDFISGLLPPAQVLHAYVPEISGRERRKSRDSKEGLLGVEGMSDEIILNALRTAGAEVEGDEKAVPPPIVSPQRFYEDGLSGKADSAARRLRLQQRLGLPSRLSSKRLMEYINAVLTEEQYAALLTEI